MKKLTLLFATIILFACNKPEDVLPEDQVKQVTLTCYSEKGIINLKYIDINDELIDTTINSINSVIKYNQIEDNYQFSIRLISNVSDSLHLKVECDGKKAEEGCRSNGGNTTISISLSELK